MAVGVTGFLLYSLHLGQSISERRETTQQIAAAQSQYSKSDSLQSQYEQIRAGDADEAAVDLAFVQLLLSVVGLLGIGFTVRYARLAWVEAGRSADIARDAIIAEGSPYIVADVSLGDREWRDESFGEEAIWFTLRNAGSRIAFITKLHREWRRAPPGHYPDPIDPEQPSEDWKSVSIPIAPGDMSPRILAYPERSPEGKHRPRPGLTGPDEWVFFLGYVEFENANDTLYRSGFCFLFDPKTPDVGLHLALVWDNPEQYNYHRKVT
ncbi:MAG: hypothetical protein B7Z12_15480 [Caulobacter vibrioides]|uniref:Uncharacterized protein n=1 Tax=Caulobacter vibrioides TaxID=155892 RepID=A0A258D0B7_CAUVI|nr:MAG: hypothetical protein B7Z12_15480 [Caulobacter vibrioides]